MGSRSDNSLPAFGFLTVVQHEQHGLFGGYLVLNANARPLEFHCTAPIKANRAQEILYGPTLEPYLYGEQIGQTLIVKSQTPAALIFTDLIPVLAVRQYISQPVALVVDEQVSASAAHEEDGRMLRLDAPHGGGPKLPTFALGRNQLAVAAEYARDQELVAKELAAVAQHLDLLEPFGRIRGAIEEAQRGGR